MMEDQIKRRCQDRTRWMANIKMCDTPIGEGTLKEQDIPTEILVDLGYKHLPDLKLWIPQNCDTATDGFDILPGIVRLLSDIEKYLERTKG